MSTPSRSRVPFGEAGAAMRDTFARASAANPPLSGTEWRVLTAIVGHVAGYSRTTDRIYVAAIAELAGLDQKERDRYAAAILAGGTPGRVRCRHTREAIKSLHERGLIGWAPKQGQGRAPLVTLHNLRAPDQVPSIQEAPELEGTGSGGHEGTGSGAPSKQACEQQAMHVLVAALKNAASSRPTDEHQEEPAVIDTTRLVDAIGDLTSASVTKGKNPPDENLRARLLAEYQAHPEGVLRIIRESITNGSRNPAGMLVAKLNDMAHERHRPRDTSGEPQATRTNAVGAELAPSQWLDECWKCQKQHVASTLDRTGLCKTCATSGATGGSIFKAPVVDLPFVAAGTA